MNNKKTLFCAISENSKWVRAVILEDGKFRNGFRTPAQRDSTLEELSRFFDFQFITEDSAPSKIVIVGSTEAADMFIIPQLIDDCPGLFQTELLLYCPDPDIQRILAMDVRVMREESTFRRLELFAHLCFLKHNWRPLDYRPDKLLLEWNLDRARKRCLCLEEDLERKLQEIPF